MCIYNDLISINFAVVSNYSQQLIVNFYTLLKGFCKMTMTQDAAAACITTLKVLIVGESGVGKSR